jgi:hypothetical protein
MPERATREKQIQQPAAFSSTATATKINPDRITQGQRAATRIFGSAQTQTNESSHRCPLSDIETLRQSLSSR